jgi:cytochrome c biogenesis protein
MKFAIWMAVALALVSVGGVLVQEFFPVRSEADARLLSERLPGVVTKAFFALHLHDPFRAGWFRVLLGALAASLLVCSARRFGSALRQAFRLRPVREPRALALFQSSATLHHVTLDVFDDVVARLRRRFYRGTVERGPDECFAALHQGGLSRTGPVLLHLGILALVFAGLVSSLVGRKSFLEASPGETVAIAGSGMELRLDDFQVEKNAEGMIKQYRSQVSVLRDGVEVARQEISVNHPLRHAGYNIYQATYGADPERAASLAFSVRDQDPGAAGNGAHAGAGHGHTGPAHARTPSPGVETDMIQAHMDGTYEVPGFPGWEFRVERFFGHLMLSDAGPTNGGRDFANPAAQLVVLHEGRPVDRQWAFLRFPAMARAELPFVIEMRDATPAVYSGLEVNTNPGAPLVWFGLALSTLGLLFSFLLQHRCMFLVARPGERGWTLWIAGRSDRERVHFERDFERFVAGVRESARRRRAARTATPPQMREEDLERRRGPALMTPFV